MAGRKTVAHIGGGLCLLPTALSIVPGIDQTVYEKEGCLSIFCPKEIRFVAGDWRDTIKGRFDLIVWDLPDPCPREELEGFLTPDGIIVEAG
jgi:hypothetical protein